MKMIGNVESLEKNGGIAFRGVAVLFADHALEFAELHAIFVGHFRLGVDLIALLECRPEPLVAHNDGIDHAIGIKGELILAQNPELSRTNNGPLLRVDFTSQQLHESGLAGAIGARKSVALADCESG